MGSERLWIRSIVNNNVVLAVNERGQERVLLGKGVGFKQHPGAEVDRRIVVREFVPKNKVVGNQRYAMLADVPVVYLEVVEAILEKFQELVHTELDEGVYLDLVDHISFAVTRLKKGLGFHNSLLPEIRTFYPQEFQVALYGLEQTREKTGFVLPEDEAGAIAMHLVNGELQYDNLNQATKTTRLIQKILRVFRDSIGVELDERSLHYTRFITHLKFFAQRLFKDEMLDTDDQELQGLVRTQYRQEYACAEKIAAMIWQDYAIAIPEEEMMYLTVYIRRITRPDD